MCVEVIGRGLGRRMAKETWTAPQERQREESREKKGKKIALVEKIEHAVHATGERHKQSNLMRGWLSNIFGVNVGRPKSGMGTQRSR